LRLPHSSHDAEETSCPFGRKRNGFILGAGGHLVVLERAETASSRGAPVTAEVLGVGRSGVPCGVNQWPLSPDGLIRSMRAALAEGGLAPSSVDVFASANSTAALDRTEAAALESVFGPCAVPVVALKGALGDFGASGSAALSAAISCLRQDLLPPTLGADEIDPECRVRLNASAQPFDGRVALINASAAGGSHYSLLVRVLRPGEFEQEG
jgi:3-oxoacyl-[acyl-carrier-protein] synthase II